MKALTINRMAAARLRANRKTYISLIVGIFLSVFLVTTLVLCIQGVLLAQLEQIDKRMGYEDAFLLDTPELPDSALAETGYFDSIGHVYISAAVKDIDIYLGWYDDAGASLLRRQLLEGRMPEKAGEIAMERSAMLAVREDGQWQLGDQVTLNLTPIDGVAEQRTYTLVGVLAPDATLFGDDFKSEERTFSLITQVIGRAGRGEKRGRALIQTFVPENRVMIEASEQDYETFYQNEIICRKVMLYPPFCSMRAVGFSGERESEVIRGAESFLRSLTALARQKYPDIW